MGKCLVSDDVSKVASVGVLEAITGNVTIALRSEPPDGSLLNPDREVKSGLEKRDLVLKSVEANEGDEEEVDDRECLLTASGSPCLLYASAKILSMSTGLCGA